MIPFRRAKRENFALRCVLSSGRLSGKTRRPMKASDVSVQTIVEIFRKRYSAEPRLFYAPGRINLIGEHTDYNGGFVMPFAIDRGVTVAAARRTDPLLSIYSMELEQKAEIDITSPAPRHSGTWLDYVEGIVRTLSRRGVEVPGADILV